LGVGLPLYGHNDSDTTGNDIKGLSPLPVAGMD